MTLIGWDDTYPAADFTVTPPGDGSFIIKNNWGRLSAMKDISTSFTDNTSFAMRHLLLSQMTQSFSPLNRPTD